MEKILLEQKNWNMNIYKYYTPIYGNNRLSSLNKYGRNIKSKNWNKSKWAIIDLYIYKKT